MKVLIAPDKFKGSLSGADVAAAIRGACMEEGVTQCTSIPLADGGDGFLAAIATFIALQTVELRAVDALGRWHETFYLWDAASRTAYIELAEICGLAKLSPDELQPMQANSFGVGMVMAYAVKQGAQKVVLGLGGSASTDGGMGLLTALGAKFCDEQGCLLQASGEAMKRVGDIQTAQLLYDYAHIDVVVAADVTNVFYGEQGAAYVFGPQKGATDKQVRGLDQGLRNLSERYSEMGICDLRCLPRGGAAGGIAGALVATLNARICSGFDYIRELVGLDQYINKADLIITGEGYFDTQSLQGKVVGEVISLARKAGVPAKVVCGQVSDDASIGSAIAKEHVYALVDDKTSVSQAMTQTALLIAARTKTLLKEKD